MFAGWFIGSGYCTVLIFGVYVLNAGIRNCHVLIIINRIWAVFLAAFLPATAQPTGSLVDVLGRLAGGAAVYSALLHPGLALLPCPVGH